MFQYLNAEDKSNLEILKKKILVSPYQFSSMLSSNEIALGETILLSNRVKRGNFKVAGKPALMLFSTPQKIIPYVGLNLSVAVNQTNSTTNDSTSILKYTNQYQILTDSQGEAVVGFTPTETGKGLIEVFFLNVPKNYVDHVNRLYYRVFSPSHMYFSFWLIPSLLFFLFIFLLFVMILALYRKKILSTTKKLSSLFSWFFGIHKVIQDLFPYFSFLSYIPSSSFSLNNSSRNKIFLTMISRQICLIGFSVTMAIFVFYSYILVFMGIIFLIGFIFFSLGKNIENIKHNRVRIQQFCLYLLIIVLIFGFDIIFIREYYDLNAVATYLSPEILVFLTVVVLVILSPSVWVGLWILLSLWTKDNNIDGITGVLQNTILGIMQWLTSLVPQLAHLFHINNIKSSTNVVIGSHLSFLEENFFYLALLSIVVTVMVYIGCYMLFVRKIYLLKNHNE